MKLFTLGMILLVVTSCSTSVKLPISNILPAAEISASKKKDKNNDK